MFGRSLKSYVDEFLYDDAPVEYKIANIGRTFSIVSFIAIVAYFYITNKNIDALNHSFYKEIIIAGVVPTLIFLISSFTLNSIYKHNPEKGKRIVNRINSVIELLYTIIFTVVLIPFTKQTLEEIDKSTDPTTLYEILFFCWGVVILSIVYFVFRLYMRKRHAKE